ncbi:hypothetical protein [Paraburkholderia sp. D1E]|uniref:hypothetical protein n=1 Tax=Paraburkholderia sp. D1E TaxID=3461398 RepID=UPI0040458339
MRGRGGGLKDIVDRQLALFEKVDPSDAEGVKKKLGKTPPVSETALPQTPAMRPAGCACHWLGEAGKR